MRMQSANCKVQRARSGSGRGYVRVQPIPPDTAKYRQIPPNTA